MELILKEKNGQQIVIAETAELMITDLPSALDFIMTVQYESGCNRVAVKKEAIIEDFFRLSTGLAGEVLQKFINYHTKLAIYGDFSHYTSKPLHDFIYECNNGNDIFFVSTLEKAEEALANAK